MFMATRQVFTKDGSYTEVYQDKQDLLKEELAKASSLQQEIDAIKKYLGVL